jgi:hypothetical protein
MLRCVRTTIDLNDEVLRRAKQRAADEGVPLREVVEAALRNHLARRPGQGRKYTLKWRPERGRLRPGVQLDDRQALFDLMDGRE